MNILRKWELNIIQKAKDKPNQSLKSVFFTPTLEINRNHVKKLIKLFSSEKNYK